EREFGAAGGAAVGIAVGFLATERRGDRRDAGGGEALAADAPADRPGAAADRGAGAHGFARSGLDIEAALQRLLRRGGDDVDHAADRLAAPQDRLRPAQHFD